MLRLLSGIAAVTLLLAAVVPVSATDLNVDYGPVPVPPPPPMAASGYSYMLHRPLHKMVPVRTGPSNFSRVLFSVPSGEIPALTGRCTRDLNLASIAGQPVFHRWTAVHGRWCEVAGLNGSSAGWIDGAYIKPF
ncbi:hypothetical protein BH10PSE9_BH10PSE9_18880 [soil metagenome]